MYFKSTPNNTPSFTFNGQYSDQKPGSPSATTALTYADILMGLPSAASYTLTTGSFNQEASYHAVFAQDDFRVSQKLTLNLGLRYEYELGQKEQNNRYNVGFDPNISYSYPAASGPVTAKGGLRFAGVGGAPVHCCSQSHVKFSPRAGFAYQVNPRMVVHGGFGVFYAPVGLTFVGQGYSQATAYSPNTPSGAAAVGPNSYLSNPFPNGFVQPSGNTLGPLTSVGGALGSLNSTSTLADFGRRFPLVQQYSFDVQQDLPGGINFKLSYIGAHSRNIINSVNINQLPDSALAAARQSGTQLNASANNVTNPYYATSINGYPATGQAANKTISLAQSNCSPFLSSPAFR